MQNNVGTPTGYNADIYERVNTVLLSLQKAAYNTITVSEWNGLLTALEGATEELNSAFEDMGLYITATNGTVTVKIGSESTQLGTAISFNKSDLGLSNVDNTSDLAKPISTAVQTALDAKANTADVNTALNGKASIVASATEDNLVAFDNTGDIKDSRISKYAVALSANVNAALAGKLNKLSGDQYDEGKIVVVDETGEQVGISTYKIGTDPGDVPYLNGSGKLPNSTIPSLAIGELITNNPSTKANLTTLSAAEKGDIATVTADTVNNNGLYWLNGSYNDSNAWVQIVGPSAVISVAGKSGEVTLGISDIQNLVTTLAAKAAKVVSATEDDLASLTSDGDLADSGIPKDKVAHTDGSYDLFTSGLSKNLQGRANSAVGADFTFRTAGGSADIGNPQATIKSIHGKTLVWNQLVNKATYESAKTVNGITFTPNADGSITINGTSTGAAQYNIFTNAPAEMAITGHKYLLAGGFASGKGILLRFSGISGNIQTSGDPVIATGNEANYLGRPMYILVGQGNTYSNLKVYPQFFDLTKIYGSGNEPTTVAPFKASFSLPCYAYDTGSLLHFNGTVLKTVGFNQWDEEWELGAYNADGSAFSSNVNIRTKNIIRVLPNTTYYFRKDAGNYANGFKVYYLDANNAVISTEGMYGNNTFTTPINCVAMKWYTYSTVTTYNHDICINLSHSGYRNGEYEPYWASTLALPIATYFPTGMKSAGSVYDELTEKKAIQRVGVVDLGTLGWQMIDTNVFCLAYSDLIQNLKSSGGCVCTKYTGMYLSGNPTSWSDKTVALSSWYNSHDIVIKDTSYSDAATFKTAMSGVYLYYELSTPTETDIDISLTYKVDDFGTEQLLPENTSTPTTSPFVGTIHYAMNAVDAITNMPNKIYRATLNIKASDDTRYVFSMVVGAIPSIDTANTKLVGVPAGVYRAVKEGAHEYADVEVDSSGNVYIGGTLDAFQAEDSSVSTEKYF